MSLLENSNCAADKRKLKIFISYASDDKDTVRVLYSSLINDGFDPWLDTECLLPGEEWQLVIPKEVGQSDIVLVCLSKRAASKTGYVQKEIRIALDAADERPEGTMFLIPVKLEECKMPSRLSKWHWVTYYEFDGYNKLINALRKRARELGLLSHGESENTSFIVQVNGKLKLKIDLPSNWPPEQIKRSLLAHPRIVELLGEAAIKNIIYVPNHNLWNIVT